MGKAIQCPTCGRKHGIGGLPDAPSFACEGCGQRLRVPAQFRPSVMASARHVERPDPGASADSTSVLPPKPAPTAAAAAPSATARRPAPRSAPARPPAGAAAVAGPRPIALPLRLLTWVVALALALVVTVWVARTSGWLSGDRLVDVFTGTGGITRYLRVLALAPLWALITTLFLTGILEGGRALSRRRAAARANRNGSRGQTERAGRRSGSAPTDDAPHDGDDGDDGDGQGSRFGAKRRRAP
jgi:hypothetical protein